MTTSAAFRRQIARTPLTWKQVAILSAITAGMAVIIGAGIWLFAGMI